MYKIFRQYAIKSEGREAYVATTDNYVEAVRIAQMAGAHCSVVRSAGTETFVYKRHIYRNRSNGGFAVHHIKQMPFPIVMRLVAYLMSL